MQRAWFAHWLPEVWTPALPILVLQKYILSLRSTECRKFAAFLAYSKGL